ncbi:MAG TPA: alcohol dehydrogenase [Bdellovibrionales bacterium]|nr:MAG: alcohol dehydrogenase [Bdellovibrionales bacterium GWB1_52_6]OFZ05303.1 MAG: alcohol dehydrogenase [Bdellovibrionales bacterium GWA1_52_35]OFZ43517.1 MAG: alcohol dehydrogenase [Bdellovibrionales bacterium GWC1_52_8]HAR44480.1 alcohol dehydrogenase [Bdellovibrionales bacterium]HCM38557.1 alcohol dehydrogenase [Bdellovibrionales bacterium]
MHVRNQGNNAIQAYVAQKAHQPLEKFEYTPSPLGPWDVEVVIDCCGICHSDVHLIDNDWGMDGYPLVPGHEIVGFVHEKGAMVRNLQIGQRVGVGWQRGACLECEQCISGNENLCPSNQATCVGHYGGFASEIRVDSRFVFPIPEALESENAAPLLCGGITVYSPLQHFNVRPSMKVGVVGVGGLGHLGIQFARAFGCEVTAISHSPDKENEARKFGARHFIFSSNKTDFENATGSLDFILSTATANLNWASYLNLLRPDGRLCFVGVPSEPVNVPAFALIGGRKSICGSPIGSRTSIREMLDFAALHKIQAQVEVVPMTEVNSALDKVRNNQARYRMVLKNLQHFTPVR